ncbi:phage tail tip lysozyme [Rhizobium sp. A37_96]
MTEALVLPATVVDGFTKPLKNLVSRLKDVKVTDGMKQVGKQMESLRKEAEGVGKAVTNGFGGLTTGLGLGALGAGAFTAAGALTAVGTAVRSFADNAVRMRKFSHETGIAVTTLQKMQQVSDGLAIDPDSIASGLSFAARNADAMRLRQGSYGAIAGLRGGRGIAEDLANTKSNDEVVQKELNYLAMQKNAQSRRTLSELFFGTGDFAEFGANGKASLDRRMAAAGKNTYVPSEEDTKKAEAFQDAISHLSATFENLKNSVGGELAPQIIAAADAFKDFADAHVGDVKEFFHDVGDAINKVDWAGTTKNFQDLFTDIKNIVDWASGLQNPFGSLGESSGGIVKGSPADKLLQWWRSGSGSTQSGSDQDVPFWAPLPSAKKSSFSSSDSAATARPIAYHPGMQAAFAGASTARDSAAVAILAKGVELGMIAFTQSYLGGGAAGGMGGGDGFQTVSYGGGRATFGGGGTGGSFDIGRAGTAPIPTGSKAQRAKGIVDSLMAAGMSRENAITWAAATMGAESGYGHDQRGDYVNGRATAFGSAQWHMPRVRDILKGTGIDVRSASMDDQTKAMIWEMKKTGIWNRAVKAGSAQEVLRLAIKEYERPLDQGPRQFNNRAAIANALRKSLAKEAANAGLGGAAAAVKPPTGKVDIHVHSKDHPVTVKQSDSELFQGLKIDRGKSVSL